jgi:4'-phosphopantetheinyl transferase
MTAAGRPPAAPSVRPGAHQDQGSAGAVAHLWCSWLDGPPARSDGRLAWLSADEVDRAARFHFTRDRDRWMAARLGLREVLGAYLGVAPGDVRLTYGVEGKPALDAPRADLSFNLTHCEGLAVIAIARGAPIGVDVERVHDLADIGALATRFFSSSERDAVLAGADGVTRRFFACWTRKEALIKATGLGLTFGLDRFAVSVPPDDPPRVLWMADEPGDARQWSLVHFEPAPGFVGAVAVRGPVSGLRVRWWA